MANHLPSKQEINDELQTEEDGQKMQAARILTYCRRGHPTPCLSPRLGAC